MTNNKAEEFSDEGLCLCSVLGAGGVTAFNRIQGQLHFFLLTIYSENNNPTTEISLGYLS
jgi:hypothetical protein